MGPTDPAGADSDGPYFFLSYARIPKDGPDDPDPDLWVHRLFRDVCDHIRNLTTVPAGAAGYMDRSAHPAQAAGHAHAASLAGCRVFVPLYSPRYFINPWCGKEWTAFGRRPGFVPGAVVPALWVPVPEHRLPDQVREIPYLGPEHTERYQKFGLYGLAKLRSFRNDYQKAVLHLAQRIVKAGENTEVEPGDPGGLGAARDAFAGTDDTPGPPATRRRLRISVAAGTRDHLPRERDPRYYGPSPLDWRPYHPEAPDPLGTLASGVPCDRCGRARQTRTAGRRRRRRQRCRGSGDQGPRSGR
ncbi:TIR-like protein FxsC, partial [Streptomyces sp. S6]